MELQNLIISNRVNKIPLSASSIKAYISTLKNLFKKVYPDEVLDCTKFNNAKDFIDYLEPVPHNKRKTLLATLLTVATDKETQEKYRELMLHDATKYNTEQTLQIKDENQQKNWITQDELNTKIKACKVVFDNATIKSDKDMSDIQTLQNYIILCLVSGKYIPPRRSLDWTEMTDQVLPDTNLYSATNKQFTFSVYKTAKFYKAQNFDVPTELGKILSKWIKIVNKLPTPPTYLLFDRNGNKLTPVTLNQRLNAIFGKKISINILRHSYVSEKYKDMPNLQEMMTNANAMGHSIIEHLQYIKNDLKDLKA